MCLRERERERRRQRETERDREGKREIHVCGVCETETSPRLHHHLVGRVNHLLRAVREQIFNDAQVAFTACDEQCSLSILRFSERVIE